MRKPFIVILAAAVLFLLIFRGVKLFTRSDGGSGGGGQPAVAVETARVTYGPVRELRRFTGTVHPYNRYVIAPKISGRLVQIGKRIGDEVGEGEMVARMDDAEFRQELREAEASLMIAQASLAESASQLELARQEKERVGSLEEKGLVTAAELEAALSNYEARVARNRLALAQVEQSEAALESARIRLGYTLLKASRPGLVGERFVDEGALLAPNTPVVLVVGIDSVIVRTTITERDYGRVRKGQKVEVLVDTFPGMRFSGTVARIAPMMREASRMAEMEVEVENGARMLKPGMFARIEVTVAEKGRARLVPATAVVERAGRPVVFLVSEADGTARMLEVSTGIVTPEVTEILEPAIEGRVVTLGQHLLDDGSPVTFDEVDGGATSVTGQKENSSR
jgi:RND family efflux transporter MFP subunit